MLIADLVLTAGHLLEIAPDGSHASLIGPTPPHTVTIVVAGAVPTPPVVAVLRRNVYEGWWCRAGSAVYCPSLRVGGPGPMYRAWRPYRSVPAQPEEVGWPPVGV